MPENTLQVEIANEALDFMFKEVRLRPVSRDQIRTEIATSLELAGIQTAKEFLRDRSGKDNEIDPFIRADGVAWVIVSTVLAQMNLHPLALDFALEYLGICYEQQEVWNQRIKKGAPHFWISLRYEGVGDLEGARAHMILAFIEDVKDHHPTPKAAPAYAHLTNRLDVSVAELKGLELFAGKFLENFPWFPEEILIRYQLGHELGDFTRSQA